MLPRSAWPVHRSISHPVFESDTLRGAKRQATLYCKNHQEMSKWYELDPAARWRELFQGILVRKTFRNPPVGADAKEHRAIVEIIVAHKN